MILLPPLGKQVHSESCGVPFIKSDKIPIVLVKLSKTIFRVMASTELIVEVFFI